MEKKKPKCVTVLKIIIVGSFSCFLILNSARRCEARIREAIDLDGLIEESDLICEAQVQKVGMDSTARSLTSEFKISEILKGEVAGEVIEVTHPYQFGIDANVVEFKEGADYILFLEKTESNQYNLTFNERESRWLKYKGKDRVRNFLSKEKGKLDLKEQLLYEIGQWVLDPYYQESKGLTLLVPVGSPQAEYRLFLSEYPWFTPILEKVKNRGGYAGCLAEEFLGRSKGEFRELGHGKVYREGIISDIEKAKVRIISLLKEAFPETSLNIIESQEEDVRIVRIILKIPGYSQDVREQLRGLFEGVPSIGRSRGGDYDKLDNLEIVIRDKGKLWLDFPE